MMEVNGFSHTDLVYGKNVARDVYYPMLNFLDNVIYNR